MKNSGYTIQNVTK